MAQALAKGKDHAQFALPLSEPRSLPRWGFWTLNTKTSSGMAQRSYRLDQLEYVLTHIRTDVDSYMSQCFFSKPNRRAINVAAITHGYVDLDTYKSRMLAGLDPDQICGLVLLYCRDEGIPPPSYIVYSGRGLYLKWSWKHVLPKAAAGRAIAVNRALVARFKDFGADPASVDMSRILRIVGTVNTKSGETAQLLWVSQRDGQPLTYDFEMFADEILPYSMEQIREWREGAIERAANLHVLSQERAKRSVIRPAGGEVCWEDWHWGILCDLERLAQMRWGGIVPEGSIDTFGFIGAVQLAHCMNGQNLWHEVQAWARKILPAGYVQGDMQRHASTLLRRAAEARNGQKVMFGGKLRSPIYTYSKAKLIELLKVEPEEQRDLTRLIGDEVKRERNTEAKRAKRRAEGAIDRQTYEANSVTRQKPWEALGMSRRTWYRKGSPTA